jgi:hypothetical protein
MCERGFKKGRRLKIGMEITKGGARSEKDAYTQKTSNRASYFSLSPRPTCYLSLCYTYIVQRLRRPFLGANHTHALEEGGVWRSEPCPNNS